MEQKKQCYVAPEVTVVKFAIERGFLLSAGTESLTYGSNAWGNNSSSEALGFGSNAWGSGSSAESLGYGDHAWGSGSGSEGRSFGTDAF